ncbi:MAG: single-stranded DNA-binding protein, partial [Leptospiraceae bacterium]|nr:single-stranded DNA-binding protein [Leptospiraceae bacterium]
MIQIGKNQAFVILEGNLTADPEMKKVGNGKTVTTFSIACLL